MRLWSLHPNLLDSQGLVACWREALLAQKVLRGLTKGYRHHPQLERFRSAPEPLGAIGVYLTHVAEEATSRGYSFNTALIFVPDAEVQPLPITLGQLELEFGVLARKLLNRDPAWFSQAFQPWIEESSELRFGGNHLPVHPLFTPVPGPVASWERATLE